jgi:hypothetical protein
VQCHLCRGWFRVVGTSHIIRAHGWRIQEYRSRFGLITKDSAAAAALRHLQPVDLIADQLRLEVCGP